MRSAVLSDKKPTWDIIASCHWTHSHPQRCCRHASDLKREKQVVDVMCFKRDVSDSADGDSVISLHEESLPAAHEEWLTCG